MIIKIGIVNAPSAAMFWAPVIWVKTNGDWVAYHPDHALYLYQIQTFNFSGWTYMPDIIFEAYVYDSAGNKIGAKNTGTIKIDPGHYVYDWALNDLYLYEDPTPPPNDEEPEVPVPPDDEEKPAIPAWVWGVAGFGVTAVLLAVIIKK